MAPEDPNRDARAVRVLTPREPPPSAAALREFQRANSTAFLLWLRSSQPLDAFTAKRGVQLRSPLRSPEA